MTVLACLMLGLKVFLVGPTGCVGVDEVAGAMASPPVVEMAVERLPADLRTPSLVFTWVAPPVHLAEPAPSTVFGSWR